MLNVPESSSPSFIAEIRAHRIITAAVDTSMVSGFGMFSAMMLSITENTFSVPISDMLSSGDILSSSSSFSALSGTAPTISSRPKEYMLSAQIFFCIKIKVQATTRKAVINPLNFILNSVLSSIPFPQAVLFFYLAKTNSFPIQ